jgi:hypothetical protein
MGPNNEIIAVLHLTKKGGHTNTLKTFDMYLETANTNVSDVWTVKADPLFDALI